jgi:Leucine-rich repeat (LRR) protein
MSLLTSMHVNLHVQGIREIQNLSGCPLLEKLWIVENDLRCIQGLDNLNRLRELYLYSNHIAVMDNVSHLTNLEVCATCRQCV